MPIGEICVREVIICRRDTIVREAAQLMRQHHVGDVVVMDEVDGQRIPVGIVTDRDFVVSVIALELDPAVFTVGDLITRDIVTIREGQGVLETVQQMRVHGIRRIPVVDERGRLAGIVSIDDLIQLLAEEMNGLAKLISQEQAREVQLKH